MHVFVLSGGHGLHGYRIRVPTTNMHAVHSCPLGHRIGQETNFGRAQFCEVLYHRRVVTNNLAVVIQRSDRLLIYI